MNEPLFMYVYSRLLFDGKGVEEDVIEAEKWLRKAAELNYIPAMSALGSFLLDGDKISLDQKEGEQWLRQAVELEEGNQEKKVKLGCRLIDGDGLIKNAEEGYLLLNEASNNNSLEAIITFSNRLIDRKGINIDPIKGKELPLKAADQLESKVAMYILGNRLLTGKGLP